MKKFFIKVFAEKYWYCFTLRGTFTTIARTARGARAEVEKRTGLKVLGLWSIV